MFFIHFRTTMATLNLVGMATINISLRTVQRNISEFTDLLSKNPGLWLNVVNREGEVLFVAKLPSDGDTEPRRDGDKEMSPQKKAYHESLRQGEGEPVTPSLLIPCGLCKIPSSPLYEHWEEGTAHAVCMLCALKQKLPVHKMKKL